DISDIRLFECRSFLHSLFRIPTALSLARVDHLPDVIGVMRSDACYGGVPRLQLLLIGGFDLALPGGHHFVQLPAGGIPPAAVQAGKGLIFVFELAAGPPPDPSLVSLVPIDEVRGQLPDRMVALLVCPASLFRR